LLEVVRNAAFLHLVINSSNSWVSKQQKSLFNQRHTVSGVRMCPLSHQL